MNTASSTGLRARKRARTAQAIHVAAVELVLERGLDAATVDAISERADVSARTFFNYFPSKEDAVLGLDEIAVAEQLDKAPASVDDPLTAVFDLLYDMFEAGGGTHGRPDLTRDVVMQHPALMSRQILRVTALEGQLIAIIAGWLGADPRFATDSAAERHTAAEVILSICLATVRMSMKVRAGQSDTDSGDAEPRKSLERAVASLRTVMEKLT